MKLPVLCTLASLLMAAPAVAHEVENGPNGGRVVEAGDHHVEMLAKSNTIEVFLTDKDSKALAPTGYKGVAILSAGGKSQRIELTPASDRLSGAAPDALPARPQGVVRITTPAGKTVQGKF